MSGSRLRPYFGPLVALLVVLALGAGTVYAAIPNRSGTYYACRVKNTGAVRLINYPKVKTCPAGQKLIKWSATGVQGPAGPAGPVGPAGPADWNAIANKPAGFADGVDNGDTTRSFIAEISDEYSAGQDGYVEVTWPVGLDVKVTLIPAKEAAYFNTLALPGYGEEIFFRAGGQMHLMRYFGLYVGGPSAIKARVTVWNDDYIAPAAAKRMVNATFHKGSKRPK